MYISLLNVDLPSKSYKDNEPYCYTKTNNGNYLQKSTCDMEYCPLECWGQESNHYLGQQSVDECVNWNKQTKYPWFKYCSKSGIKSHSSDFIPGGKRSCIGGRSVMHHWMLHLAVLLISIKVWNRKLSTITTDPRQWKIEFKFNEKSIEYFW